MDIFEDVHLLWVAIEGLKAPLPQDWSPCMDEETGELFYFNSKSGNAHRRKNLRAPLNYRCMQEHIFHNLRDATCNVCIARYLLLRTRHVPRNTVRSALTGGIVHDN